MPQMAPLNWLLLFIFFSIIFLFFNTINFYSFLYQIKKSNFFNKKKNYNWKW